MALDRQRFFDDVWAHAASMTKFAANLAPHREQCKYRVLSYKDKTHANASCLIGGFLLDIPAEDIARIEGKSASNAVGYLRDRFNLPDVFSKQDLRFMNTVQECHDRPALKRTVFRDLHDAYYGNDAARYGNTTYQGTMSEVMDNLRMVAAHYGLTIPE